MTVDFSIVDMPSLMKVTVRKESPDDPDKFVEDDGSWHRDVRITYSSLLKFFEDNKLLINPVTTTNIDEVVINLSDLSEIGQKLVWAQSIDRWLASFDRPGSKKAPDDVRYLEKALKKLRESGG